mmetsp:Transcript_58622/g.140043  ORF Transcript_58622/g.140043 Transcript_58622/m.140043 type:complete len:222 (-) Transcript_58622:623-1288(-)
MWSAASSLDRRSRSTSHAERRRADSSPSFANCCAATSFWSSRRWLSSSRRRTTDESWASRLRSSSSRCCVAWWSTASVSNAPRASAAVEFSCALLPVSVPSWAWKSERRAWASESWRALFSNSDRTLNSSWSRVRTSMTASRARSVASDSAVRSSRSSVSRTCSCALTEFSRSRARWASVVASLCRETRACIPSSSTRSSAIVPWRVCLFRSAAAASFITS